MAIVESLEALRATTTNQRELLTALERYLAETPPADTLARRQAAAWIRQHVKSPKLETQRDALLAKIETL